VPEAEVCTAGLLLVVSREPSTLNSLWNLGRTHSWQIKQAASGLEAREQLESGLIPDLVLLDMTPGAMDILYALRWLHRARPELPVILLSCTGEPEAGEGVRSRARVDWLVKPIPEQQLGMVLQARLGTAIQKIAPASAGTEQISEDSFFIAATPVMRNLRAQIELLAKVNVPVLILGESGSGKEITARLIHKLSGPCWSRFLKAHCAALPTELLESEMFGYDRGALAGTHPDESEESASCARGTILLDEIAEMPGSLQARLLYAMQDKQFFRLGGESTFQVRILAATSTNIEQALNEKKLRMDLYKRLSVFTVHVPPLRKRKDDIPLLLEHFMNRMAKHYRLPPRPFSAELLWECQRYCWPGNVRELENFVKRYLVMEDDSIAANQRKSGLDPLPEEVSHLRVREQRTAEENNLKTLVRNIKGEAEKNVITTALEQTHWNRKEAAQLLRISYRGLLYKIQQYQLRPIA
jgi:two-component system, NtrC family, response regulator AtoC